MKKKLLGILVLALSSLFLVACTNNSLDGEYYWINDSRNQHIASINNNKGLTLSQVFRVTNVEF